MYYTRDSIIRKFSRLNFNCLKAGKILFALPSTAPVFKKKKKSMILSCTKFSDMHIKFPEKIISKIKQRLSKIEKPCII